jgi:hypothetical protein
MKSEQVRCWKTGIHEGLFITYPEGDMGHRLICCKFCGKIHAVNITKQLYIEPDLDIHLRSVTCMGCARSLGRNWAFYPDTYVGEDGQLHAFERPQQIPKDSDSVVMSFPEVFS